MLSTHITIVPTYAWTDLLVALSWLATSHDSFKPYVFNSVHQIHTLLTGCRCPKRTQRTVLPVDYGHHSYVTITLYWRGANFVYNTLPR